MIGLRGLQEIYPSLILPTNDGQGTYKTQIPFASGKKFVMVMSDASGFGAGGATDVLDRRVFPLEAAVL